jgi:hypothetical protein
MAFARGNVQQSSLKQCPLSTISILLVDLVNGKPITWRAQALDVHLSNTSMPAKSLMLVTAGGNTPLITPRSVIREEKLIETRFMYFEPKHNPGSQASQRLKYSM